MCQQKLPLKRFCTFIRARPIDPLLAKVSHITKCCLASAEAQREPIESAPRRSPTKCIKKSAKKTIAIEPFCYQSFLQELQCFVYNYTIS